MATLRQQFLRQVVVNAPASPSSTNVDVFGPESTLEPPYAETVDHVIRERQARQNEAGFVVIDGWGAPFNVDTINIDIEIWSRGAAAQQKGLEAPLFPSGSTPGGTDPVLKRVVATGLLGLADDLNIKAMFGGGFGGRDSKDVPLLHVRAGEFVRVRVNNVSAGALGPLTLNAKFDLGMSPADTNRL